MDEKQMNIQWYPGHMTKTRRQMEQDLKQVDAVCEIVDARIPISSRNPDIDSICGNKPRIVILNRMDLADPEATAKWADYFRSKGWAAIATDCKSRKGINAFAHVLPFANVVDAGRAVLAGNYAAMTQPLMIVCAYALALSAAAVVIFASRMRRA